MTTGAVSIGADVVVVVDGAEVVAGTLAVVASAEAPLVVTGAAVVSPPSAESPQAAATSESKAKRSPMKRNLDDIMRTRR